MAFYKDFEKKTRQEKRDAAFSRGGYEDEGAGYGSRARASFNSKRANDEKRGYQKRYYKGQKQPHRKSAYDIDRRQSTRQAKGDGTVAYPFLIRHKGLLSWINTQTTTKIKKVLTNFSCCAIICYIIMLFYCYLSKF